MDLLPPAFTRRWASGSNACAAALGLGLIGHFARILAVSVGPQRAASGQRPARRRTPSAT